MSFRAIVSLTLRLALAALFIFSAVMKLRDPGAFAFGVKGFKIIPAHLEGLIQLVTYAVPWTELAAAVALLLPRWSRAGAVAVMILMAGFSAGIASVMLRGIDANCSCFGSIKFLCTGPMGTCHLVRNGVIFLAALVVAAVGAPPLLTDPLPRLPDEPRPA